MARRNSQAKAPDHAVANTQVGGQANNALPKMTSHRDAHNPTEHREIDHPTNGAHGARPAMLPWRASGRIAAPNQELPAKTLGRASGVRR